MCTKGARGGFGWGSWPLGDERADAFAVFNLAVYPTHEASGKWRKKEAHHYQAENAKTSNSPVTFTRSHFHFELPFSIPSIQTPALLPRAVIRPLCRRFT